MCRLIENRDGKWWVSNPAHEEENFADKWNEYPQRREAFLAWHRDLTTTLDELLRLQGKGLPVVAARMAESFTPDAVTRSAHRYGERLRQQIQTQALRMGSNGSLTTTTAGTLVRGHTFHGQHTHPCG